MNTGQHQPTGFQLIPQALRATEEQYKVFKQGVDAVLLQWTALNLVSMHRDSTCGQTLRDEVLRWYLDDGEIYSDELEEYFEDFFSNVRSVSVEDNSCKEVADIISLLYRQCCNNDDSGVLQYCNSLAGYQQSNPALHSVNGGSWEGTEDGQQIQIDLNSAAVEEDEEEEDMTLAYQPREEDPVPIQQPKPNVNKGKNPFKKGADGWCTVQRKR